MSDKHGTASFIMRLKGSGSTDLANFSPTEEKKCSLGELSLCRPPPDFRFHASAVQWTL